MLKLLALLLLVSSPSMASDEFTADFGNDSGPSLEKVNTDYLKIIGRGIQNKKTKDIVALACTGFNPAQILEPSCKELRYVIWKSATNESFFTGEKIVFNSQTEPSEAELNAAMKRINANFKKFKKDSKKLGNHRIWSQAPVAALIPIGIAIGVNQKRHNDGRASAISTETALLGTVGFVAAVLIYQHLLVKSPTPESGIISSAMADRSGWNWAIEPRSVSAHQFNWLVKYIN